MVYCIKRYCQRQSLYLYFHLVVIVVKFCLWHSVKYSCDCLLAVVKLCEAMSLHPSLLIAHNTREDPPKHQGAKPWCPNNWCALELLSEYRLGFPSHMIKHTGTNDLRDKQERVATALKGAIQKVYSTFPNATVVFSILLPRKYVRPATIQRVNASISRDCVLDQTLTWPTTPAWT